MTHTQRDYELDKNHQAVLDAAVDVTSAVMKAFPRNAMGLTPDDVKASDTYKAAKKSFDMAFANLRSFNAVFVKKYKNELAAERLEARKA